MDLTVIFSFAKNIFDILDQVPDEVDTHQVPEFDNVDTPAPRPSARVPEQRIVSFDLSGCDSESKSYIIEQVFIRMSMKDIVRCMIVCKSWGRFIGDPGFRRAYENMSGILITKDKCKIFSFAKNIFDILDQVPDEVDTHQVREFDKVDTQLLDQVQEFLSKKSLLLQVFGAQEGIDYEKTFSPNVKMVTIICLLNIVVSMSWSVFQLDVNNAFLYGDLEESDKGVFLALLIYVDDIIITGNSVFEIEKFKVFLKSKFMIKDLGKLKYFLGIEVVDTDKAISKEASDKDPLLENITDYQKLMGKLIYLTNTKPNISYVVHCLSQFMHSPLTSNIKIAFKILRYLKSFPGLGIHITKTSRMFLTAYSDTDWAKCVVTRKSVTGYYVDSANQIADILTKGLDTVQHLELVKILDKCRVTGNYGGGGIGVMDDVRCRVWGGIKVLAICGWAFVVREGKGGVEAWTGVAEIRMAVRWTQGGVATDVERRGWDGSSLGVIRDMCHVVSVLGLDKSHYGVGYMTLGMGELVSGE
ncbi:ribonuclease H-like domain-containing protein [Tanacetum coccineum]